MVVSEMIDVLPEPINFCTFISNNLAGSSQEYSGVELKLLPVVVRKSNPINHMRLQKKRQQQLQPNNIQNLGVQIIIKSR